MKWYHLNGSPPPSFFFFCTQALRDPAPYADELESLEDRPYERVSMEEARRGTPRKTHTSEILGKIDGWGAFSAHVTYTL